MTSLLSLPDQGLQDKLASLGFVSIEHALSAASVANFSGYLGAGLQILQHFPGLDVIPPDALQVIRNAVYSLGALSVPANFSAGNYQPGVGVSQPGGGARSKNLVAQMSPVRNQSSRFTCVAFATLAAAEHFFTTRGVPGLAADLSEQWLYFNCKNEDGVPAARGTWVKIAFESLKADGCLLEPGWPYNPSVAGSEGQGPPPADPLNLRPLALEVSKVRSVRTLNPKSVDDYRSALDSDRVVAFAIPAFPSWSQNPYVSYTGDINLPAPFEVATGATGGHAMAIVGYRDLPDQPQIGGGRFVLRNSYGENWGINSAWNAPDFPVPKGYGTIPYSFIQYFASEAFAIEEGPLIPHP